MNDVVQSVTDTVSTAATMLVVLFGLGFFTVSYTEGIVGLLEHWAGVQSPASAPFGMFIFATAFVMAFVNLFVLLSFGYTFSAKLRANRLSNRAGSEPTTPSD